MRPVVFGKSLMPARAGIPLCTVSSCVMYALQWESSIFLLFNVMGSFRIGSLHVQQQDFGKNEFVILEIVLNHRSTENKQ